MRKLLLTLFFIFMTCPLWGDTSTKVSTLATISQVGTDNSWNDLDNAKAEDGNFASALGIDLNELTNILKFMDWGFSIPTGSTITGIGVRFKGYVAQTEGYFLIRCCAYKNGIKSSGMVGGTLGETNIWKDMVGSTTYTFGETGWTPEIINASDFGIGIYGWNDNSDGDNAGDNKEMYADCAEVTIYYTPGGGGSSISKVSGVAQASISKISGVANASISKVSGVANQ